MSTVSVQVMLLYSRWAQKTNTCNFLFCYIHRVAVFLGPFIEDFKKRRICIKSFYCKLFKNKDCWHISGCETFELSREAASKRNWTNYPFCRQINLKKFVIDWFFLMLHSCCLEIMHFFVRVTAVSLLWFCKGSIEDLVGSNSRKF